MSEKSVSTTEDRILKASATVHRACVHRSIWIMMLVSMYTQACSSSFLARRGGNFLCVSECDLVISKLATVLQFFVVIYHRKFYFTLSLLVSISHSPYYFLKLPFNISGFFFIKQYPLDDIFLLSSLSCLLGNVLIVGVKSFMILLLIMK